MKVDFTTLDRLFNLPPLTEKEIENMENQNKNTQAEPAYFGRMRQEYKELKDRYNKLHKMIVKYDAGTLDFKPTCPIALLREQKRTMGKYLNILEIRAEIEGVDLE